MKRFMMIQVVIVSNGIKFKDVFHASFLFCKGNLSVKAVLKAICYSVKMVDESVICIPIWQLNTRTFAPKISNLHFCKNKNSLNESDEKIINRIYFINWMFSIACTTRKAAN